MHDVIVTEGLPVSVMLKYFQICRSTFYIWKSRIEKGLSLYESVGNPSLIDETATKQLLDELERLHTMQRSQYLAYIMDYMHLYSYILIYYYIGY